MSRNKIFVVTALVFSCLGAAAQGIDLDITKAINPMDPNSTYWKGTSYSAYGVEVGLPVGLFVAGLIKGDKQLKRNAYEVTGALAIQLITTAIMKRAFDRRRPWEKYPNEIYPYKHSGGKSFPSGHTSTAFCLATSLTLEYKKWYIGVPAYLWAGSVGYSRIYLGVHYFSDVVGGAIVGTGSAWLAHWLNHKLFK
jgi:membrane-associated phospholipid phosphatase